jgi:hypothetical protein
MPPEGWQPHQTIEGRREAPFSSPASKIAGISAGIVRHASNKTVAITDGYSVASIPLWVIELEKAAEIAGS